MAITSVLILGSDIPLTPQLEELYQKDGYFLVDSSKKLNELRSMLSTGKIDSNAVINVSAHGTVAGGKHYIQLDSPSLPDNSYTTETGSFLRDLFQGVNQPMQVHLYSCFGGAAARDKDVLPKGSFLVCHSHEDYVGLSSYDNTSVLKLNGEQDKLHPFLSFANNITFHSHQGCTIAESGSNFRHVIRFDNINKHPESLLNYFNTIRNECIAHYKEIGLDKTVDYSSVSTLTLDEAAEWARSYFAHLIAVESYELTKALESNPQKFSSLLSQEEQCIFPPLCAAAYNGDSALVDSLLKAGANVDQATSEGETPLLMATEEQYTEIAQKLIAAKANVNLANSNGFTPLHAASYYGNKALVDILIKAGANVNQTEEDGYTALHAAAYGGYAEVAKVLIAAKADVNKAGDEDETPLYIAAEAGQTKMVAVLLAAKADANIADNQGYTPLHLATQGGNIEIAKRLIAAGADVNHSANDGTTALHIAAQEGGLWIAKALIASKADANQATSEGFTPLYQAICNGDVAIAKVLIEGGADVNQATSEGFVPLHLATYKGGLAIAKALIEGGADVNLAHSSGQTPLHLATHKGDVAIVKALIEGGADVNLTHSNGYTALDIAESAWNTEIANILMAAGAGTTKDTAVVMMQGLVNSFIGLIVPSYSHDKSHGTSTTETATIMQQTGISSEPSELVKYIHPDQHHGSLVEAHYIANLDHNPDIDHL